MKRVVFLYILLVYTLLSYGQLVQTVRGVVLDKDTKTPLYGAYITLMPSELVTSTDSNGLYEISNVPIGRIFIEASFMGYETVVRSNIELRSSKQLVVDVEMVEQISTVNVIVVKSKKGKVNTKNKNISVSGRTFSIDESKRYAGALNDVSRMAQNFAGVKGGDDSRNDIVVRGNTPSGILFRLEGLDIPNPNHFALFGTTGGPVSMLNNNVLTNSDFLTGAFPAEYGNAFSGAFDLSMRKGNNREHEFLGQMAFNGFELMAEGPLSKKKKSSYLVNARYSFLDLFSKLGINLGAGTGLPKYTDASFKLHFPNNKGYTSFFGLGGTSKINFEHDFDDTTNLFVDNNTDSKFSSNIGILGIKNVYKLSKKAYLRTIVGGNIATNLFSMDTLNPLDSSNFGAFIRNNSMLGKVSANFMLNYKFNTKNIFRIGLNIQNRFQNLNDSVNLNEGPFAGNWVNLLNEKGSTRLIQSYAQWKYRLNKKLTFNTGVHMQYLTYNNTHSVEPRFGLRYKLSRRSTFSFGYGKHSRVLNTRIYYSRIADTLGQVVKPNKDLEMMKSHHFVLGFDRLLSSNVRFKTELYYQSLYDIPVDINNNTFSALNVGAGFNDSYPDTLQSTGTGKNLGIELTFEHFLNKGFYYLLTTSIYDSKYKGSDNIDRNTAFNGNYTFNALIGKEFKLKPKVSKSGLVKSNRSFIVDVKYTQNGGQRYVPINLQLSQASNDAVYDYEKAYSKKYKDYRRFDFKIGYKTNTKKVTQEWAIDIQNVFNIQNLFYENYNVKKKVIEQKYQLGRLPVGVYRITF